MLTKYLIMRPDLPHETHEVDEWPREPGYDRIRQIVEPILGGNLEQVSVLADFAGGTDYKRLDMFVHDEGLIIGLPRNEAATLIYRRAAMMGRSRLPAPDDAEKLNFIAGPAVLFSRRIWF